MAQLSKYKFLKRRKEQDRQRLKKKDVAELMIQYLKDFYDLSLFYHFQLGFLDLYLTYQIFVGVAWFGFIIPKPFIIYLIFSQFIIGQP